MRVHGLNKIAQRHGRPHGSLRKEMGHGANVLARGRDTSGGDSDLKRMAAGASGITNGISRGRSAQDLQNFVPLALALRVQ